VTKRTRSARFARFGLVVVLAFTLSGAAAAASDAGVAGSNPCGEQRGACEFGCPPTCADGGCARTLPAVLCDAPAWIAGPTLERWLRDELSPPAPPAVDGVFHPPIA
jgi:hypothetical protein